MNRSSSEQGSPPRMRGKALYHVHLQVIRGITPAYAGKRCPLWAPRQGQRDHPRVCGEKTMQLRSIPKIQGSPPRMRGKGLQGHQARCRHGITPAYAGKSCTFTPKKSTSIGSPPRMRGKVRFARLNCRCVRITPAYAGKSSLLPSTHRTFQDHPRVCGEKTKKIP